MKIHRLFYFYPLSKTVSLKIQRLFIFSVSRRFWIRRLGDISIPTQNNTLQHQRHHQNDGGNECYFFPTSLLFQHCQPNYYPQTNYGQPTNPPGHSTLLPRPEAHPRDVGELIILAKREKSMVKLTISSI